MNMILGPNSTVKSTIACAYTFGAPSLSTTANNAHDHVLHYSSGTLGRLGWTDIPPDAGD